VARSARGRQLVPAGSIAPIVVGLCDDALVVLVDGDRPRAVENLASAPLAWIDLADGVEVLSGTPARTQFLAAQDEWRILTAAALVGLGHAAQRLAVQYAKDRHAFGAAIGSFQAIAHPLVDVAIGIEGARRLVHQAAWFADHEPYALGARPSIAFVHAAESAEQAGTVAIHTQGGFGFTLESDVQLFLRRAKGWSLVLGDRRDELRRTAEHLVAASASTPDVGAQS
jgi:alkylation response protein AidB-like acyl-CoA dehydrogenase